MRGAFSLALAVIMSVALTPTAWGQAPTVFEPGFFIEEHQHCTEITEVPSYNTPVVKAAACGPGGAWGTGLYVGAHTYTQGLILLLDPPNLATTVRILGDLDDLSIADMDFAPLGWRGGDLLYVTIQDGMQPNRSTGAWGLDASGNFVDTFMIHSFTESIRKLAIDATGIFGDDIFFWFGTTLYRRDAAGSLTTIPGATGIGALAFGPGGPWTSDLYTQNAIVAPDGSIRPSPVHLEGTWAHGPGFEGDLFTLCNVGQTCRVKPDGTRTLFGEGLGVNAVFCDSALWFFDRRDTGTCRAIRFCNPVDGDLDGFSECSGDCDDGDPAIHPGAADLPGDQLDQDCGGALACDPTAPWPNHGEFVSCVARECSRLVSEGIVSSEECALLIRSAAQSAIGR
jgi:hypothetical protein